MLAPSSVTSVGIPLFWPERGYISVCQLTKSMKRHLAGEYVLVDMHRKILLAIVRNDELARSSLCNAVGWKNQPTEVWKKQWKRISQQLSMCWRL